MKHSLFYLICLAYMNLGYIVYILLVCILIFSSWRQSYCIEDEHTAVVLLDDIQTKSLPLVVGNVELFYAFASAYHEF